MEARVLRHRSVAKCSSSVVAEELASFSQLLLLRLEVVVRLFAVLRMKGWGCSVFAVGAVATMLLARVELEGVLVVVWIRCLSGRNAAAVRSVG